MKIALSALLSIIIFLCFTSCSYNTYFGFNKNDFSIVEEKIVTADFTAMARII